MIDFSRKVWIYFKKKKSEVYETFKVSKAKVENQSGKKIKSIKSDNGGEYKLEAYKKLFQAMALF